MLKGVRSKQTTQSTAAVLLLLSHQCKEHHEEHPTTQENVGKHGKETEPLREKEEREQTQL